MELQEKLKQFSERINTIKETVKTEEATKTSLIMPFFQLLGYDVFNPLEFVPEFIADVGIKKGEKVDYAIIIEDKPLIVIECKSCGDNLDKYASQLYRYFGTTTAKFAILTNGIVYRFYTDLEDKNKMDSRPFLTIDLSDLKDRDFNEISKFSKDAIDVENILNSAEELKYSRLIKEWISKEIEDPSQDFVRLAISNIYEGIKNQKIIDKFTPIVKKAVSQHINDSMNHKIKNALNKEDIDINEDNISDETEETIENDNKIITTMEELEAYAIIKSILREKIDINRIFYKDTESYFGILVDNNTRKWVCRIYILNSSKYIIIPDENKKQIRYDIETLNDLYNHQELIQDACIRYI